MPTALLLGDFPPGSLEGSYQRAFQQHGWSVSTLNMAALVSRRVRFKRAGAQFLRFVAVEPWMRKVNADLLVEAARLRPDVVVTFGMNEPLRLGGLAQLRAVHDAKVVCVWPDPLINWSTNLTAMLPLIDVIATYSEATVPVFSRLGARSVLWVPLGADPTLHAPPDAGPPTTVPTCDVSFIGGWRQSRQEVLSTLGDFDLKIWGPGWGRRSRSSPTINEAWQGRSIVGAEFTAAVQASRVNLNLIDPTGFPAANMRTFELLAAGGLQLSSACPEFEHILRHGEHLFYFDGVDELPAAINKLLADPDALEGVADRGRDEVLSKHTYLDRVASLIQALGL